MRDIEYKKILVLGGTGFIGRHLISRLIDKNEVISVSLNQKSKQYHKNLRQVTLDITNKASVVKFLRKNTFNYVFNLGGYVDHCALGDGGQEVINQHFTSIVNIVDNLNRDELLGFVQIGSSDEYGDNKSPLSELSCERPISCYSLAKVATSKFIQMISQTEKFPGVVLRFFLVYGPGQHENRLISRLVNGFLRNEKVAVSEGEQVRDFLYVEDAVDAMIKAAIFKHSKSNIYNIASGNPIKIKKVIRLIHSIIGSGVPNYGAIACRKLENMVLYADISSAERDFGWKPNTSLKSGLLNTVEYCKKIMEKESVDSSNLL